MKKILIAISIVSLFCGCASTFYRTGTSFYLLQRGMSKEQFINWDKPGWIDKNGKQVIGGRPYVTKTFKHGGDIWEVWVYQIYDCTTYQTLGCVFDRYEHVAFKNGAIEEWGTGELPITIRQNPNQFQYDININK